MAHGARCGQVPSQVCSCVVPSFIIVPVRQHDHEMLFLIRLDAVHLRQIARMLARREQRLAQVKIIQSIWHIGHYADSKHDKQ